MVQISASSLKIEIKPENFNGLKDVIEINTEDRFRYASGKFADYSAAVNIQEKN